MNQVIIDGHLGKEPESKYTKGGTPLLTFSMANNEKVGEKTITQWINVKVWGKQAEYLQAKLGKGSGVLVVGKIETRQYDDRKTGEKRSITEIVAVSVKLLQTNSKAVQQENEVYEDDIKL